MLTDLFSDVSYATRRLAAWPGFTFAVVFTLALGIGANVLVLDLIDGVYFRSLPFHDDAALVYIQDSSSKMGPDADGAMESIPDYLDRRREVPALVDSALYVGADLNLLGVGAPEQLHALRATPSLFSTLGVGAALGRTFNEEEAQVGKDKVVILGDALWRNRFNADPAIIGRDLHLSGETYRVIGVMPAQFVFPDRGVQLLVPFAFSEEQKVDDQRFTGYAQGIGRLAPGATAAQVKAQSDLIVRRNVERIGASGPDGAWYARYVESNGYTVSVLPLREYFTGSRARELVLIQFAVALVLLIVCANIANLMLVRLSARLKELSVRAALGASRARVARQLLVEALLLAMIGGAFGIGFAVAGGRVVAASELMPDWVSFGPSLHLLAFGVALSLLAGGLFGVVPILASANATPQRVLREAGRLGSGGRGARATRNALVVTQLALAVALLASAGLLLRSFANLAQQKPGFTSSGVLTAAIALPDLKYAGAPAQARAFQRMLDEARRLPGVTAAGLTSSMPFSGTNAGQVFRLAGQSSDTPLLHAALRRVDDGYFSAMGIPLLQGRTFTQADWNPRSRDVIVDELFAHKHFPDGNAIGSRLNRGGGSDESDPWTIVGVVGSVKHGNLAADVSKETFYVDFGMEPTASAFLAVRTNATPSTLIEPLRAAVRSVDPDQPLFSVMTLDQRLAHSLTGRRVPMQLISGFAALALLLAAIGIYGVLAFAVAQRTGEFGVRMAIGADASRIRWQVLGDGARLTAIGLGIGVLGAFALGLVLKNQLFGVGSIDLPSLAAVAVVLAATALVACWLPARRAARVAPLEALRYE